MPRLLQKNQKDRLLSRRNIWISTVRRDGRPHLIPVWFVWVRGRIFICTEPESVKAKNLRHNCRVAVALEDGTRPLIGEGVGRFVEKPWPKAVVRQFREKYDWDILEERRYCALIELTPRKWLHW